MTSEQSPSVQAAVVLERRLTTIEGNQEYQSRQLDQIDKKLGQLVDRVGTQNGRIGKTEDAIRDVKKQLTDYEELVAKPRWASFETVKTKVESMWTEFSVSGLLDEKRERFWSALKRRADIISIAVATVLALRAEDIVRVLGG